jgi:RimJ/RimL family protein N-acetyltransferase
MRLETKRLVLREWRVDEIEAMYRWHGNPAVARYLTWGASSIADSRKLLELALAEQERSDREYVYLAIELKTLSSVIGDAGFHWISRNDGERIGELGYFLEPAFWGRGYATEAARAILRCAFEDLNATQMQASCDERNLASERVMRNCGMRRDPGHERLGRRLYSLSRMEWVRRRPSDT